MSELQHRTTDAVAPKPTKSLWKLVTGVYQSGKRMVATIVSMAAVAAGVIYTQQDRVPIFRQWVYQADQLLRDGVQVVESRTGVDVPDEEFRERLSERMR